MIVNVTWWMVGILFLSYFIIPPYVHFLGKSFGKGIVDGVDELTNNIMQNQKENTDE